MSIKARYVHTNLMARDWRKLVRFYCDVFGCEPKPPERDLSGAWLDWQTSLRNAHLKGLHLRLPGHGADGPTLEIFSFDEMIEVQLPVPNQPGFGHVAFAVDDVAKGLQTVIANGGSVVGEVVKTEVAGVGTLTVVYARDPEGNIVELQNWS